MPRLAHHPWPLTTPITPSARVRFDSPRAARPSFNVRAEAPDRQALPPESWQLDGRATVPPPPIGVEPRPAETAGHPGKRPVARDVPPRRAPAPAASPLRLPRAARLRSARPYSPVFACGFPTPRSVPDTQSRRPAVTHTPCGGGSYRQPKGPDVPVPFRIAPACSCRSLELRLAALGGGPENWMAAARAPKVRAVRVGHVTPMSGPPAAHASAHGYPRARENWFGAEPISEV